MFIIGLTTIDNKDFFLNQDRWASDKSDATQYPTTEAAVEMAEHFLMPYMDVTVVDWFVLEVAA